MQTFQQEKSQLFKKEFLGSRDVLNPFKPSHTINELTRCAAGVQLI